MLFKAKQSTVVAILAVIWLCGFGAISVLADDDEHEAGRKRGEGRMFTATNATFQTECSACHIAYPPSLLPAQSWQEMMKTLHQHFGTNASLDEATIAKILPFLEQNAAASHQADSGAKPVLRITETGWFKHEHDEISPATWHRASIKTASNCMACHISADKGNFDEDAVRIPK